MVSQLLLLGVLYTCVVLLSSSPVKGGDAGEAISRLSKSLGALKEDLTGQQAKPDIDVDDVDDKQHIFGSYEDDSSIYHKIVSFRNVYTVPTYIALADYDRVTDDPSTTDRVSRVSTLVADIKKLVEQQEKTEDSAGSSQSQGDAFLEIKRTALKTKSYAQLLAQRTNSTAVLKVISVDAYDMIGEYKKTKCLGRGGFGEVWQFEAPGLDPVRSHSTPANAQM